MLETAVQSAPASAHYENDHRQAVLVMSLLPFAAILSVALILWAVL